MTPSAERSTDDLPERPRVLLVDDDEVNLLLTSVALARLCTEIETAIRAGAFGSLPDRLDAMDRELATVLQAVTLMLSSSGTSP